MDLVKKHIVVYKDGIILLTSDNNQLTGVPKGYEYAEFDSELALQAFIEQEGLRLFR